MVRLLEFGALPVQNIAFDGHPLLMKAAIYLQHKA